VRPSSHLFREIELEGEPLLNPPIPQIVTYAKRKGINEVAFLTNGLTLEKPFATELIQQD